MNKILLIRHALTDTAGKKLTGRSAGVYLNAEGRSQLVKLAEWLSGIPVDVIYCSPLERTIETATAIAEKKGLKINTSDSFLELDYGRWTNFTVEELRNDPIYRRFNACRSNTRIPGGETMEEVQTRSITGIERLCTIHPGSTIAIVTHADIIKLAIAWYLCIPVDMMHRLDISPASVSMVEINDDALKVIRFNETAFLGV